MGELVGRGEMFKQKEVTPAQRVVRLWEEVCPGPQKPKICAWGSEKGLQHGNEPDSTGHMGTGGENSAVETTRI